MSTGTVKWFNVDKGYGFIIPDAAGQDMFVHVSALRAGSSLQEGDKVRYDVGSNKGKSCATKVEII